ncbi:MAG: cation diffusion facilitator family transporter [Syntrophales bacterium]|nr:cation diffusion facilitator family transporter [Syntrophales bacterium]
MNRETRFNLADKIISLSFWFNLTLMATKFAAGYFGNSSAVLADGVESAADFMVILFTAIAIRIGRRPSDLRHPYGHGKAEGIAALFASLMIIFSGIGLLIYVWTLVSSGKVGKTHLIAVIVALLTILIKGYLSVITQRVARQTGSPAIHALARDHEKDALTSIATLIGAGGAYIGWPLLDPIAAVFTSFFIFHLAWTTARHSTYELMDGQPPRSFLEEVSSLSAAVSGVYKVHEIRARRSGQYVIVDLKLEMDPNMTVKEAHEISDQVKKRIFEHFDYVGDVMIHINPAEEPHEDLIRL